MEYLCMCCDEKLLTKASLDGRAHKLVTIRHSNGCPEGTILFLKGTVTANWL
jgi:hypothetical protein